MRIVVIGAGGIGGWLGARLAASGQQVGFLVHGRTLKALRCGGLTLRDCSNGEPGAVTARVYAAVVSPGTVRTIGSAGSLALGEWDGSASARSAAIVAALEAAGIRAWVPDSVWAELWRKASFVVVQGALGAAAQAPIGILRSELRDAFIRGVEEVVAVASGLGHDLATDAAPDPVTAVMALADAQPAGATTSMQRDIAAGLPSELDAQLGAVCRAGDETGVPTPVLDLAHAVLAPREAGARARG
ncbi:ketopantoate reductase C-terminal domain-containing protein [Actinomyces sp. ZJ308]|uniref:ketopantoate reductase family protein n=1 Tax=Actinomyces sp. ZJ308 TaxID=2708342 RepID=UPI001421E47C|nr:ketopantoate reductase C-terminal domain-containing protein [Actinomyces sp. ZJ308]